MGLELQVPNFTTLSRRGYCPLQTRKLESLDDEEDAYIIIDSTGLKVFGESEWLETKHGKQYTRKCWRKLHVGVSKKKYFVSRVLTTHLTDDRACLGSHLKQVDPTKVTECIADTGYDGEPTYQLLDRHGIKAVIPPPSNAKISNPDHPTPRDKVIAYIQEKGQHAWQNKNNFGRRAHVENGINRYKMVIGSKLNSRNFINQDAESHLGCFIMNTFTSLGMPTAPKIS
jgi:transposase